jgi:hypothetical protein
MTKIKINNPNHENQMVELDEEQLLNVIGGTWHIYHAPSGRVIKREWENDGRNAVEHHHPVLVANPRLEILEAEERPLLIAAS